MLNIIWLITGWGGNVDCSTIVVVTEPPLPCVGSTVDPADPAHPFAVSTFAHFFPFHFDSKAANFFDFVAVALKEEKEQSEKSEVEATHSSILDLKPASWLGLLYMCQIYLLFNLVYSFLESRQTFCVHFDCFKQRLAGLLVRSFGRFALFATFLDRFCIASSGQNACRKLIKLNCEKNCLSIYLIR